MSWSMKNFWRYSFMEPKITSLFIQSWVHMVTVAKLNQFQRFIWKMPKHLALFLFFLSFFKIIFILLLGYTSQIKFTLFTQEENNMLLNKGEFYFPKAFWPYNRFNYHFGTLLFFQSLTNTFKRVIALNFVYPSVIFFLISRYKCFNLSGENREAQKK